MTAVDVVFRYGRPPGPAEVRALDAMREVYGIRRIRFNERERTIQIEYDASRLTHEVVASLLRNAGYDIGEQFNGVASAMEPAAR